MNLHEHCLRNVAGALRDNLTPSKTGRRLIPNGVIAGVSNPRRGSAHKREDTV